MMKTIAASCRASAWEPVPHFRAFLEYGILLKDFSTEIQIRSAAVSDVHGQEVKLTVLQRGIWGTASIAGTSIYRSALHS